eukprot:TRINITY_DN7891_c0_g1_i1.p1 TRINITY_DN7891_c0_g1~~TRINITY_DN7891_c0_g1_i1.p1  ORF type:complete len:207 (-),score=-18.78 TRINITY_DN7891_c0_g1_i1:343-963(-)
MRVLDLVQDKDEFLDRIFVDQIQIFQIFVSVRFRQIQISQIQQYYRNTCNIIAINLQFYIGVSRIFKFIFTYFGIEQPLLQLKNLVCSSHVIRTILIKCCYSYIWLIYINKYINYYFCRYYQRIYYLTDVLFGKYILRLVFLKQKLFIQSLLVRMRCYWENFVFLQCLQISCQLSVDYFFYKTINIQLCAVLSYILYMETSIIMKQ